MKVHSLPQVLATAPQLLPLPPAMSGIVGWRGLVDSAGGCDLGLGVLFHRDIRQRGRSWAVLMAQWSAVASPQSEEGGMSMPQEL